MQSCPPGMQTCTALRIPPSIEGDKGAQGHCRYSMRSDDGGEGHRCPKLLVGLAWAFFVAPSPVSAASSAVPKAFWTGSPLPRAPPWALMPVDQPLQH
jgi:hypothetical protein